MDLNHTFQVDESLQARAHKKKMFFVGIISLMLIVIVLVLWFGDSIKHKLMHDESTLHSKVELSGHMYFSGLTSNTESGSDVNTYKLNLETGAIDKISKSSGDHSFYYVDARHSLFVGKNWRVTDESNPDYWSPMWYDHVDDKFGLIRAASGWNEIDLVAHPNDTHVAYAQQPEQVDTEASRNLANWEVIIAVPEAEKIERITGASAPHWVSSGLVYLKTDGVYYRDLDSVSEVRLYGGYSGLTRNADLAVSADGGYLVVTIPGLGAIEVLKVDSFTENGVRSVYVHNDPDKAYHHPVFDSVNKYFATVRFDSETPIIEFRGIDDALVLAEKRLDNYTKSFFALNYWSGLTEGKSMNDTHNHNHE